ncbi:conserved hypothetical protein [Wolbachia endosymbiont of Drosophila ananassae]|nr:conserved hypothetical protein [Wolbachia endosymbiont of Drosophila ananassae]
MKESEQPLSATALNNKSDSGYSSPTHDNNEQSQVNREQLKKSLENIEQSDQTPPENLLKEIRDRSQQDNRGLRQVDPTDKLSQDKEDGLQKDDLADVKIVEGPTVSVCLGMDYRYIVYKSPILSSLYFLYQLALQSTTCMHTHTYR